MFSPSNPEVSETVASVLDEEVKGLLNKGAISEVAKVTDQYMTKYLAAPKSKCVSDIWCPILNLKKFNKSVQSSDWENLNGSGDGSWEVSGVQAWI